MIKVLMKKNDGTKIELEDLDTIMPAGRAFPYWCFQEKVQDGHKAIHFYKMDNIDYVGLSGPVEDHEDSPGDILMKDILPDEDGGDDIGPIS